MIFVSKSSFFHVYADRYLPVTAPVRKSFYILFHASLRILTKTPQKHRLFSARARAACRNKHFFSPQSAAILSACRRILLPIPGEKLPKGEVLACFFPFVFLIEAGEHLPVKKQRESRKGVVADALCLFRRMGCSFRVQLVKQKHFLLTSCLSPVPRASRICHRLPFRSQIRDARAPRLTC